MLNTTKIISRLLPDTHRNITLLTMLNKRRTSADISAGVFLFHRQTERVDLCGQLEAWLAVVCGQASQGPGYQEREQKKKRESNGECQSRARAPEKETVGAEPRHLRAGRPGTISHTLQGPSVTGDWLGALLPLGNY